MSYTINTSFMSMYGRASENRIHAACTRNFVHRRDVLRYDRVAVDAEDTSGTETLGVLLRKQSVRDEVARTIARHDLCVQLLDALFTSKAEIFPNTKTVAAGSVTAAVERVYGTSANATAVISAVYQTIFDKFGIVNYYGAAESIVDIAPNQSSISRGELLDVVTRDLMLDKLKTALKERTSRIGNIELGDHTKARGKVNLKAYMGEIMSLFNQFASALQEVAYDRARLHDVLIVVGAYSKGSAAYNGLFGPLSDVKSITALADIACVVRIGVEAFGAQAPSIGTSGINQLQLYAEKMLVALTGTKHFEYVQYAGDMVSVYKYYHGHTGLATSVVVRERGCGSEGLAVIRSHDHSAFAETRDVAKYYGFGLPKLPVTALNELVTDRIVAQEIGRAGKREALVSSDVADVNLLVDAALMSAPWFVESHIAGRADHDIGGTNCFGFMCDILRAGLYYEAHPVVSSMALAHAGLAVICATETTDVAHFSRGNIETLFQKPFWGAPTSMANALGTLHAANTYTIAIDDIMGSGLKGVTVALVAGVDEVPDNVYVVPGEFYGDMVRALNAAVDEVNAMSAPKKKVVRDAYNNALLHRVEKIVANDVNLNALVTRALHQFATENAAANVPYEHYMFSNLYRAMTALQVVLGVLDVYSRFSGGPAVSDAVENLVATAQNAYNLSSRIADK